MRDKLIELIKQSGCVETWDYYNDDFIQPYPIDALADHLIANGVTVNRWRPASEPPKENGEERVAVFLQDNPVTATIGNNRIDTDRYLNGRWVRWGKNVTHWMPLPMPPKGEEE